MIKLDFEKCNGLIPAIAQDAKTGEILMLAYMNKEAWKNTLKTGKATYFSRSRNKIWVKGETSGNAQIIKEIRIDCDNDAVILKIEQKGGACHLGYRSCFYRKVKGDKLVTVGKKVFNPKEVYGGS
mgnify:FL=1